jgi:hypothetical protein
MPTRLLASATAAFALLSLLPVTTQAGNTSLKGNTTNGPLFDRPTETGAMSFLGSSTHYNVYQFSITQNGAYNLTLVADDPSSYDTFLHLYRNGFDPAAPYHSSISSNAFFLGGNDDATADPAVGSALNGINLLTSDTYFLVVDGFSNTDFGAYTATINGPGNISASAVPEPSAADCFAVAGSVGLLGWVLWRRRVSSSCRS